MALSECWSKKNTTLRKIGPETSSGDLQGLLIDLSCPHLDCEHRLQPHNRQARNHRLRTRLFEDAVHIIGSVLLVVAFPTRARIDKVVWQISVLAVERSPPRKASRRLWKELI